MSASLGTRYGANNTSQNASSITVSPTISASDSILLITNLSRDDTFTLSCTSFPGSSPTIDQIGSYYTGDNVGNQTYGLFVAVNPGAGAYTFQWAGTPVGNSWPDIDAYPLIGCETSSFANLVVASGPHNFQNNPATTTDLVTSGTAQTPSSTPCLVVGVSVDSNAGNTPAAGTGFTSNGTGLGFFGFGAGGRVASKRITSGTAQALFTSTGSGALLATMMVAFKEAAAAPTDNRGKDPTRMLNEGLLPHFRMSPRSERRAQQYLRAQKRAYGFLAAH